MEDYLSQEDEKKRIKFEKNLVAYTEVFTDGKNREVKPFTTEIESENCHVVTTGVATDGGSAPFQTKVLNGPESLMDELYLYQTREDALAGHQEMVSRCTNAYKIAKSVTIFELEREKRNIEEKIKVLRNEAS